MKEHTFESKFGKPKQFNFQTQQQVVELSDEDKVRFIKQKLRPLNLVFYSCLELFPASKLSTIVK